MKKKILLVLGGILILTTGIILIPKNNNNRININNETEINLADLETNSFITDKNSKTIIADDEDKNLSAKELAEKYDIPILNETEEELNNSETKEFKEVDFSKNEDNIDLTKLETEQETQAINLDNIEVSNINDTYTSSTSENIVPVVASPTPEQATEPVQTKSEPQELETQADIVIDTENLYTTTPEQEIEINNSGYAILTQAQQAGVNTHNIDNPIYIMSGEAYASFNGQDKAIRIYKENDYYNVDIFVNVKDYEYNKIALQELTKLISYNNSDVFDSILDDYLNETLNPDEWTDSTKGFMIKYYGNKEQHLTRYSIRY